MTDNGLRIGTAPDSWGVWFPDDPRQTPWRRFLDEVVAAGYVWIELGPYGYLPTDPHQLADELGSRGLKLAAGTVFTGFHKGPEQWDRAWKQALEVAGLASKLGARHLVVHSGPLAQRRNDRGARVADARRRAVEAPGGRSRPAGEGAAGGIRDEAAVPLARRQSRRHRARRSSASSRRPTSGTRTCAWTRATSRTTAATTSRSSSDIRRASASCISSRSIPACSSTS